MSSLRPAAGDATGSASVALPADCRRCGRCCFSAATQYVRVTGHDWTRLGPRAEELAHFIGHRAFMRMRGGHCAALQIQSGAGGAQFFCTVYEHRPAICRELARGSPQCAAEVATKSTSEPMLTARSSDP